MQQDDLPATTALAWPPPGLEPLHGRVRHITARGWTASLLLCPLLIWLMLDAPGLDPERGGAGILATAALAGAIALLSAIMATAGLIDQLRRARRYGYPTELIRDVATDSDGRAAAAWFGTGEMEEVRAITRDRTRAIRRSAAFLHAAAAALPAPLLAFGILLGFRGAASLASVIAIMLLPVVLMLLTVALLHGYALLLAQWDRGSAGWDPAPVTVQDRARDWQRRTQSEAAPVQPGLAGFAAVSLIALLGIGVFLATAATLTGALAVGIAARAIEPRFSEVSAPIGTTLFIQLARGERLPFDATITPAAAGAAAHRALFAGVARTADMQPIADSVDVPLRASAYGPATSPLRVWRIVLADAAPDALLGDARHPAVAALMYAARAPAADLLGERWLADAPPVWRREWGSNATRLQLAVVARAALAARARQYDAAERDLRALISFGLLLAENSHSQQDFQAGASMVRSGHDIMGRLRTMRGDSTLERLLHAVRSGMQLGDPAVPFAFASGRADRGSLQRIAAGETVGFPAQRWNAALMLSLADHCGSLRSVLFGPRQNRGSYGERAHAALVRYPADQRLFDLIHDPTAHPEAWPDLPLPRRWVGTRIIRAVLGPRHASSICYSAGGL